MEPITARFGEQLLRSCAIEHIHVFEARNKAFSDDDVLQENIIIKLKKAGTQGDVTVSESHDSTFSDYHARALPFGRIVKDDDAERFVHIPYWPMPAMTHTGCSAIA